MYLDRVTGLSINFHLEEGKDWVLPSDFQYNSMKVEELFMSLIVWMNISDWVIKMGPVFLKI